MADPVDRAETLPRPAQKKLSKQIVGLDGLRILTAGLVLCFHLLFAIWLPGENRKVPLTPIFQPLQRWFSPGWVGVEVFFVVSGFVIAYSAQNVSAWTFLRHRWLRLFPAALICATVSAAAMLYLAEIPRKSIAFAWGRSILFSPNPTWVDGAYWTLSIEIAFYSVVFVLLLGGWQRFLPAVMAVLTCVSLAYHLLHLFSGHFQAAPHFAHVASAAFRTVASYNVTLIGEGCHFALGVFLWLLLLQRVTVFRLVMAVLSAVCGVLQIIDRTPSMERALGVALNRNAIVALWAAAVLLIVISVVKNEAIQRALGMHGVAVFRRLGLMTYPLYLLNQTLGRAVVLALYRQLGYPGSTAVAIVLVVGLTYVVAAWLEPKLRRNLSATLDRLAGRVPVNAAH